MYIVVLQHYLKTKFSCIAFNEIVCFIATYIGGPLKQVRAPRGGGVRYLTLPLDTTCTSILTKARSIFQLTIDKWWNSRLFTYKLVDVCRQPIVDLSTTLETLLASSHFKQIRIYLATEVCVYG